jgi:hypothetical protein
MFTKLNVGQTVDIGGDIGVGCGRSMQLKLIMS